MKKYTKFLFPIILSSLSDFDEDVDDALNPDS